MANVKSNSLKCYLFEVAFEWELTKETIHLPLGCLQGGCSLRSLSCAGKTSISCFSPTRQTPWGSPCGMHFR